MHGGRKTKVDCAHGRRGSHCFPGESGKGLRGDDEACEKVVVPCGGHALEALRILAGRSPDQIVGHLLQRDEVGRGVFSPDAAFIVAKDHVHDPVQAVLDDPVVTDHRPDRHGGRRQRGYVEARFSLVLTVELAGAFDHDDPCEARPIMALLQPSDIVDRRVSARLDAAVIAVERLVPAHDRVFEAIDFLLGDEQNSTSARSVP